MSAMSRVFHGLFKLASPFPAAKQILPVSIRGRVGLFLYLKALPQFPDRVYTRKRLPGPGTASGEPKTPSEKFGLLISGLVRGA